MAEEKNSKNIDYMPLALISIVAIVAIVGVVILFENERSATAAQSSLTAFSGGNVAGQAGIDYSLYSCDKLESSIQLSAWNCYGGHMTAACEQLSLKNEEYGNRCFDRSGIVPGGSQIADG